MRRRGYPGCIEWRGNACRVILTVEGKRHKFLLKTRDKRVAEAFARVKFAELAKQVEREQDGLPGPVTVTALLDQYEHEELPKLAPGTQRTYRVTLAQVRAFFTGALDLPVDRVRAAHIKRFLSWRATRRLRKGKPAPISGTLGNRSLQKERTVLHTLFALAEECEYRDGNPVARTKMLKADPRMPILLSDAEYGRLLLECTDPMLYLYVVLLGESGLRDESEALWLRWDDVDLENGFITIVSGRGGHRTKSGKGRSVPMTKRLTDAFRAYSTAHSGEGWVFAHPTTARRHLAGERITSLRRGVMAAAKRAGIDTAWHPHDLRHRRVTTWLAAGKDVAKVRQAVGHADLRTTMGYTHLVPAHLRDLVDEPATGT
jgi:integrase/recombinase XerD